MSVRVRLTQLDGKLPNLALMKLSSWHKQRGDKVHFTRSPYRDLHEPAYDVVYGSAIFDFSAERVARLRAEFPGAIIGGSGAGTDTDGEAKQITVADAIGHDWRTLDYSLYPDFDASIGFSQRGCRFKCGFCSVPTREGKPRTEATIADIWRGPDYPRKLHLLDNDFFGVSKHAWKSCIEEIRQDRFKVCFSQGVNIRVVTPEIAAALASVEYRDDSFTQRRLYTAWDNLGDEALFFRGVDMLEAAGVPPKHLMAYMLVGYAPGETLEAIQYRFARMVERGIRPYPMVFDNARRDLKRFQRWAVTGLYRAIPFSAYNPAARPREQAEPDLFAEVA